MKLEIVGFEGSLTKVWSSERFSERQANDVLCNLAAVILAAGYDVKLDGKFQEMDWDTGIVKDEVLEGLPKHGL